MESLRCGLGWWISSQSEIHHEEHFLPMVNAQSAFATELWVIIQMAKDKGFVVEVYEHVDDNEREEDIDVSKVSSYFVFILPYDIALNILARISRIHRPTLSLVCKSFQPLLASRDLEVTQTLIGKTHDYIYLCLTFPKTNPKRRWFLLGPTHRLIPIPAFPKEHPRCPTVVTIGPKIYVIGGYLNNSRSKKVFLLDSRTHTWSSLPKTPVARARSSACVIDGKIYVLGGCGEHEHWGEIYDPKTQTWKLLSPADLTPDLSIKKSLDMMERLRLVFFSKRTIFCFVVEQMILCTSYGVNVKFLNWCDFEENTECWREVKGLEGIPDSSKIISVANTGGGRRFKVWWESKQDYQLKRAFFKVDIICAEISFKRRSREELYGIVEWSMILYTLDRCHNGGLVSLSSSAIVTH